MQTRRAFTRWYDTTMEHAPAPLLSLAGTKAAVEGDTEAMLVERRQKPRRFKVLEHFEAARDLGVLSTIVVMITAAVVSGVFLLSAGVTTGNPLGPGPGALLAAPSDDRNSRDQLDRDREALQREYDKTVPTLVVGQSRLEAKLDRVQDQLVEVQMAQRDLEALKTYTIGIATALGALIVGVIAQIAQSWMNGRMLRRPDGRETSRG